METNDTVAVAKVNKLKAEGRKLRSLYGESCDRVNRALMWSAAGHPADIWDIFPEFAELISERKKLRKRLRTAEARLRDIEVELGFRHPPDWGYS